MKKINCLIVEDDAAFQTVAFHMVQKADRRLNAVGMASTGAEAIEMYNRYDIDILFLDIHMPDMSGFELLDEIELKEDLQIILMTGDEDYALQAFEYGITDYLLKPFSAIRFRKSVSRAIERLKNEGQASSTENILLRKVLQLAHSRNKDIVPVPSRTSKLGYTYPLLTINLDYENEFTALDILESAEKEGLINGEFVDYIYSCNNCYNGLLHFREACPKCQSSHLEIEDLVHHFPCAYVGPVSDFVKSESSDIMECPKCKRILKHIGVDYDKPSVMYSCQQCDHEFQDPHIKAKCHDCGADTRVERLVKRKIKKYKLTKLGRDAAGGKYNINLKGFDELSDIINDEYFIRLLKNEIGRKKVANFDSTVAALQFSNLTDLYQGIGEKGQKDLIIELFELLNRELHSSDAVIFKDRITTLFLFTEKGLEESQTLISRYKERLADLIRDNFDGFEVTFEEALMLIEEDKEPQFHLRQLMSSFNDTE
jgi:response regulator of citrate/malate metabolism/Zn finger protein HypA/HybF involved in hydrogenase expression